MQPLATKTIPFEVTISPNVVVVQVGEQAECLVTVRNTSRRTDEYSFEALGPSWVQVDPPKVDLNPYPGAGSEGTARLILRPPKASSTTSGETAVGLLVRSTNFPDASLSVEATAHVGNLVDTDVEVMPHTSRHSRRGTHEVAVDNRGNYELTAKLLARDADQKLHFTWDRQEITVPAGGTDFATLTVSPKKRFWLGPDRSHPFEIALKPDEKLQGPIQRTGTMVQQALIPRWVPRALLALLALALMFAAFWAAVLRPVVKSTARAQARDTTSELVQAGTAQNRALINQMKAGQDSQNALAAAAAKAATAATANTAPPTGSAAGGAGPAAGTAAAAGTPKDGQLRTGPGHQTDAFTVPPGMQFSLTDLVLQNPAGDSGLLRIQRGTTTLLTVRLENFRDLDYHFVSPVVFKAGEQFNLAVDCANVEPAPVGGCTPAAYFNGSLRAA